MNETLLISIAAAVFALIALAIALVCLFKLLHDTIKIVDYVTRVRELENARQTDRKMFDELVTRNDDALRRIAWLESRQSQQKSVKEETEEVASDNGAASKPTITERRHRVLALAGRGQTIDTIAATLGMLTGEVELILNLNRTN